METLADREIAYLKQHRQAHLSELSFRLAVDVAKAVVGLTDSKPGTDKRLERFFPEKFGKPGFTSPIGLHWFFRQNFSWLSVYFGDVEAGLSFGDGPHKCPGAHIAIQEADIFLHKLFALDGLRITSAPRVSIKEEISGYELRGLMVAVG